MTKIIRKSKQQLLDVKHEAASFGSAAMGACYMHPIGAGKNLKGRLREGMKRRNHE